MDCSMPGFPAHHHLQEFTQIHVHWVGDAIQPSHPVIFFSCLQSFPASGSFPMSQFFASGGQSIEASSLALVLPVNTHGLFSLGLTGLNSLQSRRLSKSLLQHHSSKHQFFSSQYSLWSNSHIHTWLLEKPWTFVSKVMSLLFNMLCR